VVAANPGTTIRHVTVSDGKISATGPAALRNIAVNNGGGSISGVTFDGIALDTAELTPFAEGNVSPTDYRLTQWSVAGDAVS
jgi:hypothetical protein